MRVLLHTILGSVLLTAQDKPAMIPQDQAKDITILNLQSQLLQKDEDMATKDTEIRRLRKQLLGVQERALSKAICDTAKVPFESCKIDPQALTVQKNKEIKGESTK